MVEPLSMQRYKHFRIIAKKIKDVIITLLFGVSSNGRTRDFGSLYHGSNPCAPTTVNKMPDGAFFVWNARLWRVRKFIIKILYHSPRFRTRYFSNFIFEPAITLQNRP